MTDVGLKEYVERLILENDRRYEQRFASADLALDKAERFLREYKASSNEWRDALKDQASRMATRDELQRLDAEVQELRRARANLDGRLFIVAGAASTVIAFIVSLLVRMFA